MLVKRPQDPREKPSFPTPNSELLGLAVGKEGCGGSATYLAVVTAGGPGPRQCRALPS